MSRSTNDNIQDPVVVFQVTHQPGTILVKTISQGPGGVEKVTGASVYDGTISTVRRPLGQALELLTGMGTDQFAVCGTTDWGGGRRVLSKTRYAAAGNPPDAICRSRQFLDYKPGMPALLPFDHDVSGDGVVIADPGVMHATLCELFPDVFKGAAWGSYYSSGSYIFDPQGRQLVGPKGHHTVFAALDGADIPRFRDVLFARLWLAGRGHIFTARDGKQLPRTIFDARVLYPEQPLFAGGAHCVGGLVQRRPQGPFGVGGYVDTTRLPDLTPEEARRFEELKNREMGRPATKAKGDKARRKYQAEEVERLVRERQIPETRARKIVESRMAGVLIGDDPLLFDPGAPGERRVVTVAEVLTDPHQWDGETLADPLEPEYGGGLGKAMFYANTGEGVPMINSFAHGGRKYRLKHDRNSLIAAVKHLEVEQGAEAVRDRWLGLTEHAEVSAMDMDLVLNTIKDITGGGISQLRRDYKTAQRERKRRELERARAGRSVEDIGDFIAAALLDTFYQGGARLAQTEDGSFWKYTGTHWGRVSDLLLKGELQQVATGKWSIVQEMTMTPSGRSMPLATVVKQSLEVLGARVIREGDFLHNLEPRPQVINCANGTLWLDGGEPVLKPHDPNDGLTACSGIDYDPTATCPTFDHLLAGIFCKPGGVPRADQAELVRHVEEILGYGMQPRRFIKTFIVWIGEGDNGKTALVRVLVKILGLAAVFQGRLTDDLEKHQFGMVQLHNKQIAIDDDLAKGAVLPEGFIKKASQEQPVGAQYKFKDRFDFILEVLIFLLANQLPRLRDQSRAMDTRAQVIRFERIFKRPSETTPDDPDIQRPDLWERVFKEELPGVLNELVAGFYRVKARGSFDPPRSCELAAGEWINNASSVGRFLEEEVRKVPGAPAVLMKFVYRRFNVWCEESGVQKHYRPQRQAVVEAMKELGYEFGVLHGEVCVKGISLIFGGPTLDGEGVVKSFL